MKETVLLYGFTDQERLKKVTRALLPLGVRLKTVEPEEYSRPVGYLAGVREVPEGTFGETESGEKPAAFENEMLVMAGFASGRVDVLIQSLYRGGVGRIDYKAVLTPVNQFWDGVKLYNEIAREHEAMSGGGSREK